jgi:hypothetical protein
MDKEQERVVGADYEAEEQKVRQLIEHFATRMPDYPTTAKVNFDTGWRFYFVKENRNAYIVDFDRDFLSDWNIDQIIQRLEDAKWVQVVERNASKNVPCFTNTGVKFGPWPV